MTDILKDLNVTIDEIQLGVFLIPDQTQRGLLVATLSKAFEEIERLRKVNTELGWQLNPDRSGGQFTEEEMDGGGWL
jgi:hypothetical protein